MSDGWVCPECGLDYDTIAPGDMPVAARSYPRRFAHLLSPTDPDPGHAERIRRRPEPSVWSALEYAYHVRDVFAWMAETISRMTTDENPSFEFGDPDEWAERRRYADDDPDRALDALKTNAEELALALEAVPTNGWTRTGQFEWGERDILTMARNAVHEGHHHLRDVEHVLALLGAPGQDD